MKICAIVVTYNRKELLEKQILEVMFKQQLKVDAYYIVDNCSTDSTCEIVNKYDNSIVKYKKTESNVGGAGGFSYGLKCAFEDGYDWYILMDDDGRPFDSECFSNMKNHIESNKYNCDGLYLLNSLVLSDKMYLSFGLNHLQTIDEIGKFIVNNEITGKINPFNGTWISNGLVSKIGFPNKDFFIKGDENDYIRRAIKVEAHISTVVNSRYYHPRLCGYEKKRILGHEMYIYVEAPWKEYYSSRNYTYSFLQYGQRKAAMFFVAKRLFCVVVCKCDKLKVFEMILKGYQDGKKGKLGKIDF